MAEKMNTELGKRIKHCRTLAGYTQYEIADILKISQTTYSKIERGEIEVRAQMLLDMAHHFMVDAEYLFAGKHSKNIIFSQCEYDKRINMKVTPKEEIVLNMLRELDKKDTDTVLNILDAMSERSKKLI